MAGLILISRRRFVYDVRFVIVTKVPDAEAELDDCHVSDQLFSFYRIVNCLSHREILEYIRLVYVYPPTPE